MVAFATAGDGWKNSCWKFGSDAVLRNRNDKKPESIIDPAVAVIIIAIIIIFLVNGIAPKQIETPIIPIAADDRC